MKKIYVEKITKHIANQPPVEWLEKLKTLDQYGWWALSRREQEALALVWRAKHLGLDDPLDGKNLNGKPVTEEERLRVWLMAYSYFALWDLIQVSFSTIKAELAKSTEFPFSSALDLFLCLCTELSEYTFLHCLEPYLEISGKRLEDYVRLSLRESKGAKLSPYATKKLAKLPHAPFLTQRRLEWLAITLNICQAKATTHNRLIKNAWIAYNDSLDRFLGETVKDLHEIRRTTTFNAGRIS